MKKIVSVLILVFAFTLTTQAQKKRKRMGAKEKLTVEQQATLAVKKMALQLELTDAQQRKLKPLITKQLKERRAQREKMMKAKEAKKKMEADKRYERANQMLDKKLAFQKEMKSILNAEQYEKFKKASKGRQMGMKKRMAVKKKKMAMMKKKKRLKEKKEKKHEDHDKDDDH